MLNTQLISDVMIDWEKISRESYLRNIPAISSVGHIAFTRPVTFFVGENGSGTLAATTAYYADGD